MNVFTELMGALAKSAPIEDGTEFTVTIEETCKKENYGSASFTVVCRPDTEGELKYFLEPN